MSLIFYNLLLVSSLSLLAFRSYIVQVIYVHFFGLDPVTTALNTLPLI